MRLTDVRENAIGYLPVMVNAGTESAVIELKASPDAPGERLKSSYSPDAQILGRFSGVGAFLDLYANPLDLSAYYGGYAMVEIKVAASVAVAGVKRVGQFLGVVSSGGAGWLA